jgi:PAS domain S-box-containing protein
MNNTLCNAVEFISWQLLCNRCDYKLAAIAHQSYMHNFGITQLTVSLLIALDNNTTLHHTAVTAATAVYASDGFLQLTGYTRTQVIGRNCRFLQGPETDAATVSKLREGIAAGVDTSVFLRNFNSSGEPFWNHVFVACLKNAAGKVVNYVGIQHKLDKPPLDDILDQFVLPDITTTEDDESSDNNTHTDNMC